MLRIKVTREVALTPIKEVTITLTANEFLALIALAGQFGGEYSHLLKVFRDGRKVMTDDEYTQYRTLVEEARKGIQTRAYLER